MGTRAAGSVKNMKIKLNETVSIDLAKLIESRMLIQANSGGGKSHTIRRIIEQAFPHVQIIVIDPEGEFANMRSKFDFVYVGKDGDAPAEPRSAALLATRLLELKASAIIDLYELPPQDRKGFVRIFCDALVNAPKKLWHDVIVVIDEAHVFAPEKDQSEALGAVIDLASRGRKRGFCAILATQRPAKLSKDAAAECNNKLIGRAVLDIDRKRAAEELGFTAKEDVRGLRDLDPGEFFAFGPAIGKDVVKTKIGDVIVPPAKRGASRARVAAPSVKVKKILSQLKDLPQEAAAEALTMQQLRDNLAEAAREIRVLKKDKRPIIDLDAIDKAVQVARKKWVDSFNAFKKKLAVELRKSHGAIGKIVEELSTETLRGSEQTYNEMYYLAPPFFAVEEVADVPDHIYEKPGKVLSKFAEKSGFVAAAAMGEGEKKVLVAIVQQDDGVAREYLTLVTGYKRSTRDAYIQRLAARGYVQVFDGVVAATDEGRANAGNVAPLPTGRDLAEHYIRTLPDGECKVFEFVYNSRGPVTRDQISEATGYKRSTRDAYIQRLRVRQLLNLRGDMIKASDNLYD